MQSAISKICVNFILLILFSCFLALTLFYTKWGAGAPRTDRGPGASLNVTELWFCKVQNTRRKCCWLVRKMMWSPPPKKGLLRNFNGFSGQNQAVCMRLWWAFHFSMSFGWAPSRAHGPPKIHGPRNHCPHCPPRSEALVRGKTAP